MVTNYLFITSILAILIIIGFKLRSAGKDIENKNLTHAGNAWLVINGAAVLFFLVMIVTTLLKGSEVCNCSDIILAMSKEEIAAKGDQKKIEAVQKKYEKDMGACNDLFLEKFKGNQDKREKELNKCPSYKEDKLLKGSEVCNCSDIYLAITKEVNAAKYDQKKIDAVQKKYEKDLNSCNDLFLEKYEGNQDKIEKELYKCPSYKEVKKIMEKMNTQGPQAPQ